jgi:uncharacterized membrane protein
MRRTVSALGMCVALFGATLLGYLLQDMGAKGVFYALIAFCILDGLIYNYIAKRWKD